MQRIAAPMIGGMISSTLLMLIVIPAMAVRGRFPPNL
jgi:Cu/Ag efflux pump CusA